MIQPFPVSEDNLNLLASDFKIFSNSFNEIVCKAIPAAVQCTFYENLGDFKSGKQYSDDSEVLLAAIKIFNQERELLVVDKTILTSFLTEKSDKIIARIEGEDGLIFSRMSEDWLLETRDHLFKEFTLLKQARTDLQTGLLNTNNLYHLLAYAETQKAIKLLLIELPPSNNRFVRFHRHLAKCSLLLKIFFNSRPTLHHLGQATYAILLSVEDEKKLDGVESRLVSFLKSEGVKRVHVGSSRWAKEVFAESEKKAENPDALLDQAWSALQKAEKRGPFSFCEYRYLEKASHHPFVVPSRSLLQKLSRRWCNLEAYALVLFSCSGELQPKQQFFEEYVPGELIIDDGNDIFVLRHNEDGESAFKWAKKVIAAIREKEPDVTISAGVSFFPYQDFKKSETVLNCRKAIAHAEFFGPYSTVIFDEVSLNISGDRDFADGDFNAAVREFRRGLQCNARDVNLHNSLGATLALMGKEKQAIECFETALSLDDANFMALSNAGLAMIELGESQQALNYLEKAYDLSSSQDIEDAVINDLMFQLGRLYVVTQKWTQALPLLYKWQKANVSDSQNGKVNYLIGKAHHGEGENKQAMSMLQQALRSNEYDDSAMSLLGKIYMDEDQGEEVAQALCRKAVELVPENLHHRLVFAKVLIDSGQFFDARIHLVRCLKSTKFNTEARLLMAIGYYSVKQYKKAIQWYEKIVFKAKGESYKRLKSGNTEESLIKQAQLGLDRCKAKIENRKRRGRVNEKNG